MSDIDKYDHEERAVSRLITQFKEASTLQEYIKALLSEANPLEEVLCDIIDLRTIDTATGSTLDIIGVLVGQPRTLIDSSLLVYFGYQAALGADSYGDLSDSSLGARYKDLGEDTTGNRELVDEEYRVFIRARIAKNHSNGSIDSVASLVSFITGAELVVIQDGEEPATFSVGIGELLSINDKVFLKNSDLIPKPAGVRISHYYDFPASNPFAYAGALASGQGYDDGEYASIF